MALPLELILGSGSPRRRELLSHLGIRSRVLVPRVDETVVPGESAETYLERIVSAKQLAIQAAITEAEVDVAGALVADTTVVHSDEILGKPADRAHARRLLEQLSASTHRVLTGYRIWTPAGVVRRRVVETKVTFRALHSSEIDAYVSTGEPDDKAGAYGIQGRALAFVEEIHGSYSNVVGLPLAQVLSDLVDIGLVSPYSWSTEGRPS